MDALEILKKQTLLIVEDDDLTRESLRSLLKNTFKEVIEAVNGKEGLELTDQFNPDIVLTDLEMPVMNGVAMIEKIRENHPFKPIIVVTAFSDQAQKAIKANRVLTKPLIIKDLKKILSALALEDAENHSDSY